MTFPDNLTWTCHVCQDERPDELIGVLTTDVTPKGPDGTPVSWTVKQNVRYCKDRPHCVAEASYIRFVP